MGLLFSILGIVLAGYSVLGGHQDLSKSLGININLYWGIVLLLFGLVMLAIAGYTKRRDARRKRAEETASEA